MTNKLTKKTKFMTALSIWMIFLGIGFAIPSIIEGINIAKNYQDYSSYGEVLLPNSYTYINLVISSKAGINIGINSNENGSLWNTEIPITLAIMTKEQFIAWGLAGNLEPNIQNSTYLYHRSGIEIDNLRLDEGEFFFIVYNSEAIPVKVFIFITVIPWGHITTVAIVGFLFSVTIIVFTLKILSAAYYNGLVKIKGTTGIGNSQETNEITSEERSIDREGKFCQSCGTPLTPKDGQYCPHCGASI
ncbi:MAG: zinc ribbon domain-containing protein [Candidatus Heimdallarchaeota archaeon]|nr:zinc ribbon domain-containing protein [Candidatus Heimdallarchaeota archaeon]